MNSDSGDDAANDTPARKKGNWLYRMATLVILIGSIGLICGGLVGGSLLGLFDSSSSAPAPTTRSCVAPEGVTLSAVDSDGWVEWTDDLPGGDGSTTLVLCDGDVPRAYRIIGLVPGDPAENQGGLATDGRRRVVTEGRLRTLSTTLVRPDSGLSLWVQCLPMWADSCDPS